MGLNIAQQLQLEEVLTQAIGAPVAGAHTAETGMAAERHKNVCLHHNTKTTGTKQDTEGEGKKARVKTLTSPKTLTF